MAKRLCFFSKPNCSPAFEEIEFEFKYHSGFSVTQKQKSIHELHAEVIRRFPESKILEISTKSPDRLGVLLSAFNLRYYDEKSNHEFPVENVFQSSKVFTNGGPYSDILFLHPSEAKKDDRLKFSGTLEKFVYNDQIWGVEPKSAFYDWIYISSLYRKKELFDELVNYDAFTDIEFNHHKSYNCQARSVAIFVSLLRSNRIESVIRDKKAFKEIYIDEGVKQLTLLDF